MFELLDSLEEFIFIIEKDGTVYYNNNAASNIFNIKKGNNIKNIFKKNDQIIFFTNLVHLVEKHGGYHNFMRFVDFNNNLIFCWLNAFCYKEKIVFEVFDLRKVERIDSNINNKSYAKLLKYMSEGIAHSIRNPIMSAGGMLNRLKHKLPKNESDKLLPYIDVVEKSLYKIMSIIADIEVISGSLPATLKKVDINKLIDKIISKYEYKKNVSFKLSLEKNLELFSDSMHISFIIEEILKNSFDAIGDSEGIIEIKAEKSDNNMIIMIVDNGKGIDKDNMPLVMIPFYSTKPSNMGMGLSLSKFIIEGYEGKIALYSKQGEGTKVIINMPMEKRTIFRREPSDVQDK